MAKFFIDRPIFAIVIAILVMLGGGLSILSMPIEQYPTIAPPSIQITRDLPGRLGGDRREHGRAGDRAADERARPPAVPVVQPATTPARRPRR